jgi:hypothetical protein
LFESRGLCWNFSRESDPDEASSPGVDGIRLLQPLSEAFCGIHPVGNRAGTRAMHFSALMRHYKAQSPQGFAKFVESIDAVKPLPKVETPTEISVPEKISDEDIARLLRAFQNR